MTSGNNSSSNNPAGSTVGNTNQGRFFFIKDLEPNQKAMNLHVIVLEVTKPNTTKDGHEVRTVRIADKTGSINLSVWNEHGSVLREGDILRLNGCFTQIWKNSLQVKISNKGQVIKIGEFMMVFNETPDMSVLSPDMLKSVLDQSGMAGAAGGGGPGGSKQNSAYNCGNPNGNGNVAKTNVVL